MDLKVWNQAICCAMVITMIPTDLNYRNDEEPVTKKGDDSMYADCRQYTMG